MATVKVDGNALVLDGKRVPLLAAQFDFYRHLPMFWRPILREIKETGFPIVSTFVCWDFHELEPGVYDFSGETETARDLIGFLELCRQEQLLAFVRPGPIIDDEWPTRGPAPDVCTLERSDPLFRTRAAQWLAAVGPVIRDHQVTNDGPVAMVHLDNEVFYPHCTEASATEADASYHIPYHRDRVLADYVRWLHERTEMGEALPDGLQAVAEGRVEPDTPSFQEDPLPETVTGFRFIGDMVSSYHAWVRDAFRAAGVDVPVVTNIKHGLAYMDWQQLERDVDLIGCNNYLDDPRSTQEYLNLTWWYGLQRARMRTTWAPEFWSGSWIEIGQDTSIFDPKHYEYVLMTGIANGLRGANFFMFVERDDWHYSPISAIAKTRPNLIQPFKKAIPLLSRLRDDRRLAKVGLLWLREHHESFLAKRNPDWTTLSSIWWEDDQPKEFPEWWASLELLVEEDWDFALVDGTAGSFKEFDVLVYAGPEFAPVPVIDRLASWLEQGGALVVTGALPTTDLAGTALEHADLLATRSITSTPRYLGEVLTSQSVGSFVRADRPGCNTFAYLAEEYVAVFVCNRTPRPLPLKVSLSEALGALLAADEEAPPIERTADGRSVLGFQLDPFSVEVRMFARA